MMQLSKRYERLGNKKSLTICLPQVLRLFWVLGQVFPLSSTILPSYYLVATKGKLDKPTKVFCFKPK
jgi:hypothetical protein